MRSIVLYIGGGILAVLGGKTALENNAHGGAVVSALLVVLCGCVLIAAGAICGEVAAAGRAPKPNTPPPTDSPPDVQS